MSDFRIKTLLDLDGAFSRVKTPSDYRNELMKRIAKGRVAKELPQPEPLHADIDCGMYSARCSCGSGVALTPDWQYAACLNCGRTWTTVVFPDAEMLKAIDRVLSLRPNGKRAADRWYSWWHEESVGDLIMQNRRHGWPVPEAA